MACSDNVVRAGLTQKYRDKDTLCSMLSYTSKTFENFQVQPRKELGNRYSDIYDPPTPEYIVARVTAPRDIEDFSVPAVRGKMVPMVSCGPHGVMWSPRRHVVPTASCGPHGVMWSPRCHVVPTVSCGPHGVMWSPWRHVVPMESCGPHGVMWSPRSHVVPTESCGPHGVMWSPWRHVVPMESCGPHGVIYANFNLLS